MPYFSSSISATVFDVEVLFVVVIAEDVVNSCNFLAVERALINACLDKPKERDVLYFADSNKASIKREEHLSDKRAANAIAVIKLAIFSGSNVGDALYIVEEYLVSCCVETTIMSTEQKKEKRRKDDLSENVLSHIYIKHVHTLSAFGSACYYM